MVLAVFPVVALVSNLALGPFIDRFGRKRCHPRRRGGERSDTAPDGHGRKRGPHRPWPGGHRAVHADDRRFRLCGHHESIYRFIYAQIRRTNAGSWRLYLPRAKAKRGWRGRKGGRPRASSMAVFPSPNAPRRPTTAPSQDIGKPTSCSSKPTARPSWSPTSACPVFSSLPNSQIKRQSHRAQTQRLAPAPATRAAPDHHLRQRHRVRQALPPQSRPRYPNLLLRYPLPLAKGGIENAIGRMRRPLPRKTDLLAIRPKTLNAFVAAYNNTPRKCLDFQTPAEAFLAQLLHFKCESTFPLSRE